MQWTVAARPLTSMIRLWTVSSSGGFRAAATLGVELVYLRGGEVGPALGAARLAQIAVDGGSPAEVCEAPPVAHRIEPDAELAARLAPKIEAFRAAYPRITPKSHARSV